MAPSLSVYVQCPEKLRPGFEQCSAAIEASDIGKNYEVVMQRPGQTVREHFLGLMDHMAQAKTDLVLRLEDDVDVNRHIFHNLTSWPAIHDSRFLIGWAFDPAGRTYTIIDHMYGRAPSRELWEDNELAYSLAVLMWTRDVPMIRSACEQWFERCPGAPSQDIALSWAPHLSHSGKSIAIHAPSLVEHMLDSVPTTLDHVHNKYSTSMGSFFRDWRRGAEHIDGRGRVAGVL